MQAEIKTEYFLDEVGQLLSSIDIANVLCLLYQSFLSIGRVPSEWKDAIITPLFKKGASSNVSNYRPISLTSVFCKLMEKYIVEELVKYLLTNDLISKQQHGFFIW